MAEIVTGLFAAAGTAATAIGGTIASGASALGSAASSLGGFLSTSGVLTGLQGVTGLLSLAAKNRAGEESKAAAFEKAREAELDAQGEAVQGQARQAQLRQQFVSAMAERDVAAAAGGLDLGFGSPVVARDQVAADAERALSVDALDTANKQERLRARSASYIRAGRAARQGSLLEMVAAGTNTLTDIGTRGTVPKTKVA